MDDKIVRNISDSTLDIIVKELNDDFINDLQLLLKNSLNMQQEELIQ